MARKEQKSRDKDHLLESNWSPSQPAAKKKATADDRYFAVRFEAIEPSENASDLPPSHPEVKVETDAELKTARRPSQSSQMPLLTTPRGEKTFDLPGGRGRGVVIPSSSRSKRDRLIEQTEEAVEKAAQWLREQDELQKMDPEERKRKLEEENEKFFSEENYRKISQEIWEDLIRDPTMIPELRRMMNNVKLQQDYIDMQTRFDPEQGHGLGALNGILHTSELTGIPVSIARLTQVFDLALELKQQTHVDVAMEFVSKPVFAEQATPAFFDHLLMIVKTLDADLSLYVETLADVLTYKNQAAGIDPEQWLPVLRSTYQAVEAEKDEEIRELLEPLLGIETELREALEEAEQKSKVVG